jgi:hypothetical protein
MLAIAIRRALSRAWSAACSVFCRWKVGGEIDARALGPSSIEVEMKSLYATVDAALRPERVSEL